MLMRVKFLHEAIAGPHSRDDIHRIRVEFMLSWSIQMKIHQTIKIKDVLLHKMMFDILR